MNDDINSQGNKLNTGRVNGPTYLRRPIMPTRRVVDIRPLRKTSSPLMPLVKIEAPMPETANAQNVTDLVKDKSARSKKPWLLTTMAVLIFVIGLGVALLQFKTNHQVAAQVKTVTSHQNTADKPPDETEPDSSSFNSYQVDPSLPRFITISSLNVKARVERIGVKPNNQLGVPSNIYDTGWYENSAKPGDAGGAILIDGHVHGPTKPGIFSDLKSLKIGDIVQIERGDGKLYDFKVLASQTYPADKVDMSAALTSAVPGKLGLNLITCSGAITGNDYNDRLVVFTVLDESKH